MAKISVWVSQTMQSRKVATPYHATKDCDRANGAVLVRAEINPKTTTKYRPCRWCHNPEEV